MVTQATAELGPLLPDVAPRSVGFLVSQLGLASSKRFAEALRPLGIHPGEFALMRFVAAAEGQSQQALAERLGVPVLQPERPELDGVDTVVLAAYGLLIPQRLLDRALWLNVHPSLLPRWRGAAPIERALMAGDRETGVTIIKLVPELDAGPIAAQRAFPIEPEDDYAAVAARAAELGAELLEDVLSAPTFTPQPEEGVTYAEKIGPADRVLDWGRPPEELLNQVRALSPHIGARGELHGRPLTIWRARIEDGKLVPVEVQPDGRRRMSYDEFLRGVR
jgi:methionyl-tRNA formyltransferase